MRGPFGRRNACRIRTFRPGWAGYQRPRRWTPAWTILDNANPTARNQHFHPVDVLTIALDRLNSEDPAAGFTLDAANRLPNLALLAGLLRK